MENFYNFDLNKFILRSESLGHKKIHAINFYNSIYKHNLEEIEKLSFPAKYIEDLKSTFDFSLPIIEKVQISEDQKTIKFLCLLADGNKIETVLVPFNKKYTICLSSQVGCAMKCSFCYTGVMGLKRHLTASEIVGQYILAYKYIKEELNPNSPLPNIVFMGQGEPLHNFDNIKTAIDIITSHEGLGLGPRQITLSTAGYLPGLSRFNELKNINLAISFHSPFNDERNELIPLNKAYDLQSLIPILKNIPRLKKQFITLEYLVIKDKNHSNLHAKEIYKLFEDFPIIINLIPFNEFPGTEYKRPDKEDVDSFASELKKFGYPVMIRTTKGDDILAACGQLNSKQ